MSDDLQRLAADLRGAGSDVQSHARSVVTQAGLRVRDEARRLAPKRGLPHYARAITTDATTDPTTGSVYAEIGPVKGGQGSLGHLLEYGTSRTPPRPHLGPALDSEVPRFVKELAESLDPLRPQ